MYGEMECGVHLFRVHSHSVRHQIPDPIPFLVSLGSLL